MSLRLRLVVYLVLLHVGLAGLVLVALAGRPRWWIFAAEGALALSVAVGILLLLRLFTAGRLPDDAARLLEDSDFTSRLRAVGEPALDRLVSVYNQLADRLRHERVRLQEQHYFLGELLAQSPSGILVLDYDGRIASANPAAASLFGRGGPDLLGQRPEDLEGPLGRALAAAEPGRPDVAVLGGGRRIRCSRGRFIDTGFPRVFYVLDELTEELRQAEKAAYEKLIRMVSHEVNNTVGATASLLDSCLRYASQLREGDRADFETAIGVVIGRTEQLNHFVRAFADVVRLPQPRREPHDVGAIVVSVARLLAPECERRAIRWQWQMEADLIFPVDAAQIEQALLNVCRNAVEAIDRDGTITVRSWRRDGRSTLVIEDSGPGIPEDIRTQLFTPFFTTKPHGQGIGLTLVREILDRHGFTHDLAGPPGGPTRFSISLWGQV